MYCEKHDEVDYWACPHCLDEANAKVEKLRQAVEKWKQQIEQIIRWGNAFLGEKFDEKMQKNLLAICDQVLADTEEK